MNEDKQFNDMNTSATTVRGGGMAGRLGMGGMGLGGNRHLGRPVEKPKNFKSTWKKLIQYCKPYMHLILIAMLTAIVGSVFTIIGPDKISQITDYIMAGLSGSIDLSSIAQIGLFLAVIYSIGALFSYLQGFLMATVTRRVGQRMRTEISQKLNKLPLKYFDSNSYGNILSRITNDIDAITQTFSQSIGQLVAGSALFIGATVMMLLTSLWMSLVAIGAALIGFLTMMIVTKKSQKYFVINMTELGAINGHIEEMYSAHNLVSAYNGQKNARKTFSEINKRLKASTRSSRFLSGMLVPLMNFVGNFGYVAVCVVGSALVISGNISFGVIVAFMIYVRLFTQPMQQFAQAAQNLQATAASSERVFEILEEKEMSEVTTKYIALYNVKGNVQFHNVNFAYEKGRPVINNFSANAQPGQKIAIVGPTGAGKTTLVNLLMRFYELDDGVITVDGISTINLSRENVHSLFAMVLQDTWIFEGSIRENIVYNKPHATDDEVKAASKAVGLHHFVRTLPDGYETMLGEQNNLSDGQKQLVTIARAMLTNAPMLILDEATSSVDTRTEILIQEAMDKLMKGRTSFVIAHRLSTIKNADLILVMKDGDIIESGTHQELLGKNGFYSELYNSQFESVY